MPGLQEQARGSRPEDRAAVARLEVEKCTSLLGETSPADGGTSEPAPPLWNLPNVLTLSRVVMVPAMQVLFFWDNPLRNIACAGLFALAAITDFFDGYLARKWKITSPFGAFLDPVADKLMVAAVLIQLSARVAAAGWVLEGAAVSISCAVTLCREIGVSALREWMAELGVRASVQVGWLGKCKTAFQMVAISLLLLVMPGGPPAPFPAADAAVVVNRAGVALLWLSTALAAVSGFQYFSAAWPYLSGRMRKQS